MLKRLVALGFFVALSCFFFGEWTPPMLGQSGSKDSRPPVVTLGERLFRDDRFSTQNGDLINSCSHCHMLDEDPQGVRAYTDFFIKSWMPFRERDPRRLMVRNSPTILDAGAMTRLHFDGEFGSLEELVKGTFAGRPMGWLPGEEEQAFDHMRALVLNDKGVSDAAGAQASGNGTYRSQFKEAFGVDLAQLNRDDTITLISKAVAAYCRTLNTPKDSPYDRFIAANGLGSKPGAKESGGAFARRLLADINALEAKGAVKLTKEFNKAALQGMKIFLDSGRGNCAACHAPPLFTDQSFHNIGISQREYDRVHGDGTFAALQIPNAARAQRPAAQFRETPVKSKPGEADLGFWNFVDLKTSALRRAGESDDRFLGRMTATFKTPTLRNLNYTQPYFHDGSLHTLEEVLTEMMLLSDMARAGTLREAADELTKVRLTASDIPPLVAFMNALNEDLKKLASRKP